MRYSEKICNFFDIINGTMSLVVFTKTLSLECLSALKIFF